ncbi:MAG: DUF494 domain-containing protein, partial [Rhodoferax sp.]|nr:DUF494 domain-containing protein [Rhodoferax sp.]
MFDVLAFVYENYWNGNDCPEPVTLQRRLHDVGFSPDQIGDALSWLGGLAQAAQGLGQAAAESPAQARLFDDAAAPVQPSLRIYTRGETERLGL